jgi:peptidyl-tRNA hydrolase
MKIQVRYNKNLKMSEGKLASQVAHLIIQMGITDINCDIVVLMAYNSTFKRLCKQVTNVHIFYDAGKTEVNIGTATVLGWIE